MAQSIHERARVAVLLALATLVYANTLFNGFTMDDEIYIFRHQAVTHPSLSGLFSPVQISNIFRPVTFATLAWNWAIGQGHAWGYHLLNLLAHTAVVLLLYLVLRKLLETVPQAPMLAWVAALLFAVHPIHTEAAASIVGRSELLAAGFLLAAWLFHLGDRWFLALFCFVLALLSKESALAFVPLAVAGDYARGKLKPFFRYGWIAAVALLYLGLLWKVQGGRFGGKSVDFLSNPLAHVPVTLRILNAVRIGWKYVGLQIYPATLSCDYSYNAILLYTNLRHTAPAVVSAGIVLGLWVWALYRRKTVWFLAGAIYFAGFSVTSNILLPTGTIMGERLAYLPSAGFCLLVAVIWMQLEKRNRRMAWAALAMILVALGTRTVIRNRDWRDNFSLYCAAVKAVPGSAKMRADLALQYYYRGQLEEATRQVETALRIYPALPDGMSFREIVEGRGANDQMARELLTNALAMTTRNNSNYHLIAINLAGVLIRLGQNQQALNLLNETIAMSPGLSHAWSDRAAIHYQQGEVTLARSDAETALRLDSSDAKAQDLLRKLNDAPPLSAPR